MRPISHCILCPNGDVVLRLEKFCIQTAAKRARNELVAIYLQDDDPDAGLEAPIELLGCFLEATDFRELRSQHPELAGGTVCCVRLHACENGDVSWKMDEP